MTAKTWLTADRLLETVYVNGCVNNLNAQGQAAGVAANVQVTSDGIDYSGSSAIRTDAAGKFRLPIKRGGKAMAERRHHSRATTTV